MLALPVFVGAQTTEKGVQVGTAYGMEDSGFQTIALGQRDIKSTIAQIINIVLGVLGIVATVIILAGGFKWMTAAGNEDKVGEAKKMIAQGVIGLVIVFAAWGIASFVIKSFSAATTASSTASPPTAGLPISDEKKGYCLNAHSVSCDGVDDCSIKSVQSSPDFDPTKIADCSPVTP